jgi:hypothetical protein
MDDTFEALGFGAPSALSLEQRVAVLESVVNPHDLAVATAALVATETV